ncbi:DUF167 family protein [Camelimonas sp. ID_303_24]
MAGEELPWRIEAGALRLMVRLTPRGGRDALEGVEIRDDGRPVLKARVRAAPENGQANAALVRLLAKSLDISASQVAVTGGHTARVKTLTIAAGVAGPEELAARLARLAGGG